MERIKEGKGSNLLKQNTKVYFCSGIPNKELTNQDQAKGWGHRMDNPTEDHLWELRIQCSNLLCDPLKNKKDV